MGFFSTKMSKGLVSRIGNKIATALSHRKRTAALAAVAVGATGISAIPASAQINLDPDSMRCAPIHVVYANGTGGSSSDRSTHISNASYEGLKIYETAVGTVGGDNVSGFAVPYPSSIGSLSPFVTAAAESFRLPVGNLGTEVYSYGESVKRGVNTGADHLREYKAACPGSAFIIGGFSQGASVAGDIAARVSQGQVPGVTTDDIAGVVLYADPYRAAVSGSQSVAGVPQSRLYANSPVGSLGNNYETIVGYQGGNASYVGLAGPRPQNFAGLQGKVMSLCHPNDPACAVPAEGALRGIADFANNGGLPASNLGDTGTYERLSSFFQMIHSSGAFHDASVGNFESAGLKAATAFQQANFQLVDLMALINTLGEAGEVIRIGIDVYGNEMSFGQFIGAALVSAIPPLVESHATPDKLLPMARDVVNQVAQFVPNPEWIGMAHAAIIAAEATVKVGDWGITKLNGLLGRFGLNVHIPTISETVHWIITEGTNLLVNFIAERTGISEFMKGEAFQRLAAEFHQLGGGPNHMAYFNPGYSVNGVPSQTLVHTWVAELSTGVLNGAHVAPAPEEVPAPAPEEAPVPEAVRVEAPAEEPAEVPAEPEILVTDEAVEAFNVSAIPGLSNLSLANSPLSIGQEVVLDISQLIASLPGGITEATAPEGWQVKLDTVNGLLRVIAPEGSLLNGTISLGTSSGGTSSQAVGIGGSRGGFGRAATPGLSDVLAAQLGTTTAVSPDDASVKIVLSQNASGAPTAVWSESGVLESGASAETSFEIVSNDGAEKGVSLAANGDVVATEEYLATAEAGDTTTLAVVATEPNGERSGSILTVVADGAGAVNVTASDTSALARAATFQTTTIVEPAEEPAVKIKEKVAEPAPQEKVDTPAPAKEVDGPVKEPAPAAPEKATEDYTVTFTKEGIVDDSSIYDNADPDGGVDTSLMAESIVDDEGVAQFIEQGQLLDELDKAPQNAAPAPVAELDTDTTVDSSLDTQVDTGVDTVVPDLVDQSDTLTSDGVFDEAAPRGNGDSLAGSFFDSIDLGVNDGLDDQLDWSMTTSASDYTSSDELAWTGSATLPLAAVSLLFMLLGFAALRRVGVLQARES